MLPPKPKVHAATRRRASAWFASRGWKPLPFQREAWAAYAHGESGLIHAPTGLGKTLAAWMGPATESGGEDGLRVLWITPLRADRKSVV